MLKKNRTLVLYLFCQYLSTTASKITFFDSNSTMHVVQDDILTSYYTRILGGYPYFSPSTSIAWQNASNTLLLPIHDVKSITQDLSDNRWLYVMTSSCIVSVNVQSVIFNRVTGSCNGNTLSPIQEFREGPSQFARFTNLTHISVSIASNVPYIHALHSNFDDDNVDILLVSDAWVRKIHNMRGALSISSRVIAFSHELYSIMLVQKSTSVQICTKYALNRYTLDVSNNESSNTNITIPNYTQIIASIIVDQNADDATISDITWHIWILTSERFLHKYVLTLGMQNTGKDIFPQVVLNKNVEVWTTVRYESLFLVSVLSNRDLLLYTMDFKSDSPFLYISNPSSRLPLIVSSETENISDSQQCSLWRNDPCSSQLGFYAVHLHSATNSSDVCILAPPGGYVFQSTFVQCPQGTYNPRSGSVSVSECQKCPGGFIVLPNTTGNSVCFPCHRQSPLQSSDGVQCVASCPSPDHITVGGRCVQCLEGTVPDLEMKICKPCPAHTYASNGSCIECSETLFDSANTFCPHPMNSTCCISSSFDTKCQSWQVPELTTTWVDLDVIGQTYQEIKASAVCENGTIFAATSRDNLIMFDLGRDSPTAITLDLTYIGSMDSMVLTDAEKVLVILDSIRKLVLCLASSGTVIISSCRFSFTSDHIFLFRLEGMPSTHLFIAESETATIHEIDTQLIHTSSFITEFSSIRTWSRFLSNNSNWTFENFSLAYVISENSNTSHIEMLLKGPQKQSWWVLYNLITDTIVKTARLPFTPSSDWIVRDEYVVNRFILCNETSLIYYYSLENGSMIPLTSIDKTGRRDGESQHAKFANFSSAKLIAYKKWPNIGNALLIAEAKSIRLVLIHRICECAQDHFYDSKSKICRPCIIKAPFSMQGSRESCTSCPRGSYMDYGTCKICPPLFWPSNNGQPSKYNPCRFAYDSNIDILDARDDITGLITRIQSYPYLKSFDVVCDLPLFSWFKSSKNALEASDLLGKLWRTTLPLITFDPGAQSAGLYATFKWPGIWISCNSELMSPYDDCKCPFSTSYWSSYPFRNAYFETSGMMYVVRTATVPSENVLIKIQNITDDTIFSVSASSVIFDTGRCYIGWPSIHSCADLSYYWQYANGTCTECPTGTRRLGEDSNTCQNVLLHSICEPGYYLKRQDYICARCPPNTFTEVKNTLPSCVQKRVLICPLDFYVSDRGATSENVCVSCLPCPDGSFMQPPIPCNGMTFYQTYACLPWFQTAPGMTLSVTMFASVPTLNWIPCAVRPPDYSVWALGPVPTLCFFQCKYDINLQSLDEYYFNLHRILQFLFPSSDIHSWVIALSQPNMFPYPNVHTSGQTNAKVLSGLLQMSSSRVCSTCDLTPCSGVNVWRPLWPDGCGPPCLLSPHLCTSGSRNGCVAICAVPVNAFLILETSKLVEIENQVCSWQCNMGFFRHLDSCLPCHESVCGEAEQFVGVSKCFPSSAKSNVCMSCRGLNLEGVDQVLPVIGKCSFTCTNAYTLNPNPLSVLSHPCLKCSDITRNLRCPDGHRVARCAPQCQNCMNLLPPGYFLNKILMPSNDSSCRVLCKPNYHTISRWDYSVLNSKSSYAWGGSYSVDEILCEDCAMRPFQPCGDSTQTCTSGYVYDDMLLQCVKCKTSFEMQCSPGTYAPACTGSATSKTLCISCWSSLLNFASDNVPGVWPTRFYLPYFSNEDSDCPTACVIDSVMINGSCISCSLLHSSAAFQYRASWNASKGVRWWAPVHDPPHLGTRVYDYFSNQLLPEVRANKCWPCPISSSHSTVADDLCPFITSEPSKIQAISLDKHSVIQMSNSSRLVFYKKRASAMVIWLDTEPPNSISLSSSSTVRRLLEFVSLAQNPSLFWVHKGSNKISPCANLVDSQGMYWNSTIRLCVPCPESFYCPTNYNIYPCPSFSLSPAQSASIYDCKCRVGFRYSELAGACVWSPNSRRPNIQVMTCPGGFSSKLQSFSMSNIDVNTQLTYGNQRLLGALSDCIPCQKGTWEYMGSCIPCPPLSSSSLSLEGGATSCTCETGVMIRDPTQSCPANIAETKGSASCASQNQVLYSYTIDEFVCLCRPGTYLNNDSLDCIPCPPNSFSSSIGNAGCINCPPGTMTMSDGSVSLLDCVPV